MDIVKTCQGWEMGQEETALPLQVVPMFFFKVRWAACLSLVSSPVPGKCRHLLQQQVRVPWNRTLVSGPWVSLGSVPMISWLREPRH